MEGASDLHSPASSGACASNAQIAEAGVHRAFGMLPDVVQPGAKAVAIVWRNRQRHRIHPRNWDHKFVPIGCCENERLASPQIGRVLFLSEVDKAAHGTLRRPACDRCAPVKRNRARPSGATVSDTAGAR